MRKKNQKILVSLLIFFSALIALAVYVAVVFKTRPGYVIEVDIPQGTSLVRIIEMVNDKGALRPGWIFQVSAKYYARFYNKKVYAGYYKFDANLTNLEIMKSLFNIASLNTVKVTFPEGIGYRDFAEILSARAGIDKAEFLRLCRSDSMLKALGINAKSVEGYLMPETYYVFRKQDPAKIIQRLVKTQDVIWNEKFAAKAMAMAMSRNDVLTLASIIEAESPVADERPAISGVYHNRLNKKWMLQADPTVQYALGNKKKLTRNDLTYDSPYNTYKYYGLPPGPINSPGESAIDAALNPQVHNYMFFVAAGDGSGRHNFAVSGQQHMIYKNEMRRNRRNLRN